MQVSAPQGSGQPMPAAPTGFASLADMTNTLMALGQRYTTEYANRFATADTGGKMTTDEVRDLITQEFPRYTMVSQNPSDVQKGKHLLYIDQANMQRLADDADYRAKVFGLIKREMASLDPNLQVNMGGQMQPVGLTASVFSLSNANPSEDGIPYTGMGTSEASGSVTRSSSGSPRKSMIQELLEKIAEKRAEERQKQALDQERALEQLARERKAAQAGGLDIVV